MLVRLMFTHRAPLYPSLDTCTNHKISVEVAQVVSVAKHHMAAVPLRALPDPVHLPLDTRHQVVCRSVTSVGHRIHMVAQLRLTLLAWEVSLHTALGIKPLVTLLALRMAQDPLHKSPAGGEVGQGSGSSHAYVIG